MAHKVYENFIIEDTVAEFMNTQLNTSPFYTQDNSLAQAAGMIKTINKYTADGEVRDVAQGEGNVVSDDVEVTFESVDYTVKYVQGRFPYHDEEAMKDPNLVNVGLEKMSANMVNDLDSKFLGELAKGTKVVKYPKAGIDFDTVVDATAEFGESEEGLFMLINVEQRAEIRKGLKDDLKYVEDFVRTGYIGSINGIPIYISKEVPKDTAFIATSKAVTVFTKKEVETEQERDANIRLNTIFNRRCNVVALTDDTQVVRLEKTV